ncbi:MAG TPA: hypothetical protein VF624_09920, partial [Tepidisphaeraceae bacterium]
MNMGEVRITLRPNGVIVIERNDEFRTPELRFNNVPRGAVDIIARTMNRVGNDPSVSFWDFGMGHLFSRGPGAGPIVITGVNSVLVHGSTGVTFEPAGGGSNQVRVSDRRPFGDGIVFENY